MLITPDLIIEERQSIILKKLHSGKARALCSLSVRWRNANDSRRNSYLSRCKAPDGTKLVRSKINRNSSLNLINGSSDRGMERSLITEIEINWLSSTYCRLNKSSNGGSQNFKLRLLVTSDVAKFSNLTQFLSSVLQNKRLISCFKNNSRELRHPWSERVRFCCHTKIKAAYCFVLRIIWIFITFWKALGFAAKVNASVLATSKREI